MPKEEYRNSTSVPNKYDKLQHILYIMEDVVCEKLPSWSQTHLSL